MLIQAILIVAVVGVGFVWLRNERGAKHQAIRRLMLIAFLVLGVFSVLVPDLWNMAADWVGVGRGTDLLLYMFIVCFLGYVTSNYIRSRELESRLTKLARRIALDEVPPPAMALREPGVTPMPLATGEMPAIREDQD